MWIFGRKQRTSDSTQVRLFYSSDIHGSERCWLKFLNAAQFYNAQAIIMGGDLTGKMLVPLVEAPEGYRATFLGQETLARDDAELAALEKNIRFNGFYPYRCAPSEYRRLAEEPAYLDLVFRRVMIDAVRRWVALAEERLAGSGIACFVMAGNDDELALDDVLRNSTIVHNPDGCMLEWGRYQIIGESWVPPTPWHSPREMSEEELERKIRTVADRLRHDRPAIFVLHSPPYRSTLDDAPQVRDDLTVVTEGGQIVMTPVGSVAVRRVIEAFQPVLALHGHIHESRGAVRIGRTLCINPGSAYGEGVLHGALITLEGDCIRAHQLVSG
ncbi:metallophosphoesterase family protein [Roseiflexus sp.]